MDPPSQLQVAHPQTLQEVEHLVLTLYQPGIPPQQLVETQRRLLELQRSDHGWTIADGLLASVNPTVRFFGALTFNIKLNSVGGHLDNETRPALEKSILHWTLVHTNNRDNKTVTKLSTTLALFYLHDLESLPSSVSKLVFAALGLDASQITETYNVRTLDKDILSSISPDLYKTIMIYLNALAEEADKSVSTLTNAEWVKLKSQYAKAIPEILYMIHFALTEYRRSTGDTNSYTPVCDAAMSSLATTNSFCSRGLWFDDRETTKNSLGTCVTAGINWCITSVSDTAIEQLVELVSTGSQTFNDSQYEAVSELLRSDWGKQNLASLKDGSESGEDNSYVSLLLAYGEARMQNLLDDANSNEKGPAARDILEIMQELLRCEGHPELEDDVIPRALEFWNNFVECVEDNISEGTESSWIDYAKEHASRMAQQICNKVKLPSWEVWQGLSPEERRMLRDFRTDVKDLLQSSYLIIGTSLIEFFVNKAFEATSNPDWHEAESALFCLVGLDASSETKNDQLFSSLFGSQLYTLVLTDEDPSQITRRTAIDLLGQSTKVFKRNPQYLPAALNFLFPSLQHPKTSDQASRSIFSLCSTCRKELVPELNTFLTQYELFISLPTANEFVVERVSGAIGVLLQALPSLSQTISGVETLLKYVAAGLVSAKSLLTTADTAQVGEGQSIATKSMRCLSSIAKSLQAPVDEDNVVDLEAEEVLIDENTKQELDALQLHIFEILSMALEILGDDGDIIDDICMTFKAGFTEPLYSPFHFAPHIVVQFFSITTIKTPRLESVLRMCCSFLRSLTVKDSAAETAVSQLAQHLALLIQNLGDPRSDAEIAQSIIDVLTRFMPDYIYVLLQLQPVSQVETILGFTINAIEVPEPLPKRSALTFWNTLLDVVPNINTEATKLLLDQVVGHYGPAFSSAIVRQIAGDATRIDLESIASPLRKLLKRHVHAKMWLEAALAGQVPAERADDATKRKLLLQLGVASTPRQVKELITGFWSHCNGVGQMYKPLKDRQPET